MTLPKARGSSQEVKVTAVNQDNWRAAAKLDVLADQQDFVASVSYYLALCCYGATWQPLAFVLREQVIGFCMWGIDRKDSSCWLGGILIDAKYQGKGYGKQAIKSTIRMLNEVHGYTDFALSYGPANAVARRVYESLGFTETGEYEDDEVVARLIYHHD